MSQRRDIEWVYEERVDHAHDEVEQVDASDGEQGLRGEDIVGGERERERRSGSHGILAVQPGARAICWKGKTTMRPLAKLMESTPDRTAAEVTAAMAVAVAAAAAAGVENV
jgi:hypothetical protein